MANQGNEQGAIAESQESTKQQVVLSVDEVANINLSHKTKMLLFPLAYSPGQLIAILEALDPSEEETRIMREWAVDRLSELAGLPF